MRFGIFSDVHSNLEAFEAVVEAFRSEAVDRYIFLGDIIGYGADPIECIRLLRQLNPIIVAGNHDWGCAGLLNKDRFNERVLKGIVWTASVLSDDDKEFLTSMKLTNQIEAVGMVHSSLDMPEEFKYVHDLEDAQICLEESLNHVCLIGHTHRPVIFYMKGMDANYVLENEARIEDGIRYLINTGSVGQPRDGNPYACYSVYDSSSRIFAMKRIPYDVQKAQEKILNAGLPHIFADRLPQGR